MMQTWTITEGEAVATLSTFADDSIDCCVTSPPYWRMRDYEHPDQIGLELDVRDFIERLATVFDQVKRVLRPNGTCWVNMGDSYARDGGGRTTGTDVGRRYVGTPGRSSPGMKAGDLAGVPWRLAFALQDRGWYIRGEQIWAKTNPMPEGVGSRPVRSHEHVFLFTRSPSPEYTYREHAVRRPLAPKTLKTTGTTRKPSANDPFGQVRASKYSRERRHRVDDAGEPVGARLGSVWAIASNPNRAGIQHFAMMPELMAEICMELGSEPDGVVLDPFCGSGTTGLVALRTGRSFVGIDLRADYVTIARERILADAPLLARLAAR